MGSVTASSWASIADGRRFPDRKCPRRCASLPGLEFALAVGPRHYSKRSGHEEELRLEKSRGQSKPRDHREKLSQVAEQSPASIVITDLHGSDRYTLNPGFFQDDGLHPRGGGGARPFGC